MPLDQLRENRIVDKGRGSHMDAIRLVGPIGNDEEAQLTIGYLGSRIYLPFGWLEAMLLHNELEMVDQPLYGMVDPLFWGKDYLRVVHIS